MNQAGHHAPSLPTINASPSAATSTTALQPEQSVGAGLSSPAKRGGIGAVSVDSLQPASRIPRATTFGSIKRNTSNASQSSVVTPLKRNTAHPASSLPTSTTSTSLASNLGISHVSDGEQISVDSSRRSLASNYESPSSAAPTLGSSTLISILNAYTSAKTPAEVEVVLRRARVASHSTTISPREREVLVSLLSRQEQKKQSDVGVETSNSTDVFSTPLSSTQRAQKAGESAVSQSHRLNSALSSSSNGHISTPSAALPRKTRISMSATSSAARVAREAASTTAPSSASKVTSRMSLASSSARQSPALSEVTTAARSTSATLSPAASPLPFDEEREGDEEMEAYIRRRHSKKIAQGARLADLEKMLQFPDDEEPSKCYSQRQAEAMWGDKLTDLEWEEMRTYKEIYFVGQHVDKSAHNQGEDARANNSGYDDERGDYVVINHDHLAYRYEVTSLLGRGSFGQVLQCKDHKTGRSVAIKLIRNKKRFHHQALVEVKILENLTKWDPNEEFNVIKVLDSFYFRNHLCISMELLSINLYELIKANSFVGFSTKLIRRFTSQVLGSLSLLRRNRVVHCDLKPENILLMHPRRSAIKVIDFGSSCFEHEKVYTYIQSRFYRSPEVILGMNYHTAIDIWSLGCIIAELYSGYPLFPGENEQEQLACIMEVLGVPER